VIDLVFLPALACGTAALEVAPDLTVARRLDGFVEGS